MREGLNLWKETPPTSGRYRAKASYEKRAAALRRLTHGHDVYMEAKARRVELMRVAYDLGCEEATIGEAAGVTGPTVHTALFGRPDRPNRKSKQ